MTLGWFTRLVEAIYLRLLVRTAGKHDLDVNHARSAATKMIALLPADITAFCTHQCYEQQILTERLGLRYDLGLALCESANRALAAKKKAGREAEVPQLSGRQQAALELQKDYLQRLVKAERT